LEIIVNQQEQQAEIKRKNWITDMQVQVHQTWEGILVEAHHMDPLIIMLEV
jgi:hypothetical protein